jgi:hypothetical protein
MEPTYEFDANLFDNADQFGSEFFKRFDLEHRYGPLKLNDEVSKNYLFPTLYGDVTCAIGIYLCDYKAAKALLPHPSMEPISMLSGRSLVIFSNYIYRNVLGIAPYNEIAMTIPVMVDAKFNIPVVPMVMDNFSKFGFHVFHMPVTSKENRIRGHRLWGLPKEVERIDLDEKSGICTTTAYDESGQPYYKCDVPTSGKTQHFDVASNLYSHLDDELLQSSTFFQGDFNVNKNMGQLFKKAGANEKPTLEIIGDSPMAQKLRSLKIQPVPFQTRYAKTMNSCFDLPNTDYKTPKGA